MNLPVQLGIAIKEKLPQSFVKTKYCGSQFFYSTLLEVESAGNFHFPASVVTIFGAGYRLNVFGSSDVGFFGFLKD